MYISDNTYHTVRTLILVLPEVQVVRQRLLAILGVADGRERDLHVELAPSSLFDGEGRALEGLLGALAEGLVEQVGRFLEARRGQVFAVRADEVDGDVPGAHGEAFDLLRLVEAVGCEATRQLLWLRG